MAKRERDGSDGARPGKQMRSDMFPEGDLLGPRETKQLAEEHWKLQPIEVLHFTTVLQDFARQFDDEKLTTAIGAIIEKLKPGKMAMTPEEIFQQVQDAIESLAESDTKSYAQRTVGVAVAAAGLVYQNYTQHVAGIQASQSRICGLTGLFCKEIPTVGQYLMNSMPTAKTGSEIVLSLLAIALFSVKLKAKYEAVVNLTSTIFSYFLADKRIEVAPAAEPGGAAAAAATEDHSTQEGLQGIDMDDIAKINELLAKLKVDLDAIPTDMDGGRRRRRRQTRRRKSLLRKAKRHTKKRSCCSKRRRKTRHRHRKNRRRHHQTRR